VGIFCPIVEPPTTLLVGDVTDYFHCRTVGAKPVSHDRTGPAIAFHQALSEQNYKYLERPSNRSDRPGKMQENQWPRNPVLTFWQSKRICSDNAVTAHVAYWHEADLDRDAEHVRSWG
jgi:hypothetical protein